jgi:LmbE family N-acetylglucosaminyl deacetylase
MNKKLILPICKALLDSGFNTVVGNVRTARNARKKRIAVAQAHPDDEILIAGILQRLFKAYPDTTILTVTDGDRNTAENRIEEYGRGLRFLGYNGSLDKLCLCSETSILNLISTEQGTNIYVSEKNIQKAARLLKNKVISPLENILEENKVEYVFTDDYSGGHSIHDLTQMCVALAVKGINKGKNDKDKVEIFEFPQYWLKGSDEACMDYNEIKSYINKAVKGGSGYELKKSGLVYEVNSFVTRKGYKGFFDSNLGMFKGAVDLGFNELRKKVQLKQYHRSQGESLGRLMKFAKIRNVAVERVRLVPEDRDYSKRPHEGPLLYEVIPWRPQTLFETLKRVYAELNK